MEKSVKLAVGIYLAIILIICSSYLAFILIGSLNGKDMSNSVLDTDHSRINNTSKTVTKMLRHQIMSQTTQKRTHMQTLNIKL